MIVLLIFCIREIVMFSLLSLTCFMMCASLTFCIPLLSVLILSPRNTTFLWNTYLHFFPIFSKLFLFLLHASPVYFVFASDCFCFYHKRRIIILSTRFLISSKYLVIFFSILGSAEYINLKQIKNYSQSAPEKNT